MSAVPISNAARAPAEVPACLVKREPDAEYAWTSKRRLQITKGEQALSLSLDDLRALFNFAEANGIEVQL